MSSTLQPQTNSQHSTAIQIRQLPYQADALLTLFTPLAHHPWAMLLHSGHSTHSYGRFDILVADPICTLVTREGTTELRTVTDYQVSSEDPFTLLQQAITHHLPKLCPQDNIPFLGGAIGTFSYDLSRRFEQLPVQADKDISLPEMAVGLYNWALIADHQLQTLSLVALQQIDERLSWLQRLSSSVTAAPFALLGPWQANMNAQEYRNKFEQVQRHLHDGDCYQVNLTQRFQAPYQGDEWQAFLHLNRANQAPFSAFIRLPEQAILSLSPERFISLNRGEIQTRPIKGTRPRLACVEQDQQQIEALANASKDRAENLMIVDLLRNDIGRIAKPGTVQVPELFAVETFPAVHHLVSTITAQLADNYSATDLLRACFPGGSITGAPKIRSMEVIESLEPQRRAIYCGSIGYISCCETMDSNITIRTVLAEQGELYCWAGGGIIADSECETEYQECFDKVARILPQLAEFKLE